MSDRSTLQLHVYAVPEAEMGAVLDCIARADLTADEDLPNNLLGIGVRYFTDETPVGSAADLLRDLEAHAPGATFELWQCPVYDNPGDYAARVADVGRYRGPCDVDGAPTLQLGTLLGALAEAPGTETVAAWRDGRFSVALRLFADLHAAKTAASEGAPFISGTAQIDQGGRP